MKSSGRINPEKEQSADSESETAFFPVVAIGASAGGLEAFTDLIRALPNNTGMAFVFVQHLDPTHHSMLAELLSKAARIPVVEAKNGMQIEPNRVHVIPPNVTMGILKGRLTLTPRQEDHGLHLPVDFFMRSLAEERKSKSVGVVLSGTGSDGTLGLAAVKAEGGITFAQEPKSAKYDGMPRSAIASGCVDFILQPREISRELARISGHPYLGGAKEVAEEQPENVGAYERIFSLLRKTSGVDFRLYKPGTVRRRTLRRMAVHKLDGVSEYLKHLQAHPAEVEQLYQDLLIPVTSFFRDLEAFEALKSRVFPAIVKGKSDKGSIRIWAPGCSTGEETYSLAMLLLEFLGERAPSFHIQIFGSDVNERGIEKARRGIYGEQIAHEVSPERLRRFFVKVEEGYRISKAVRDLCVFARQNLIEDPPFSQMNLVACRNLLIYFGSALQKRIIPILHYALKSSGFLILGNAESVVAFPNLFATVDKKHKIFSKKPAATKLHYDFTTIQYPREGKVPSIAKDEGVREVPRSHNLEHEADRVVLRYHAPAGIIINSDMEIIHFRGRTSPFLEPAPGRASLNLLKMARAGLSAELRNVINQAQKSGSTRLKNVPFKYRGHDKSVTISVEPLAVGSDPENAHYLVLFEEVKPQPVTEGGTVRTSKSARSGRSSTSPEFRELRRKAISAQEQLRAVVESKEAIEEEFQSATEEILSANEELQSTNEELETSKEELQSTNEELNTVNDELRNRNLELGHLNNDLSNLVSSTTLPVVMVDRSLRIRRASAASAKVLKILGSDIGRPITDIRSDITVQNLEQLVTEVMDTLAAKEMEVQDNQDRWYSLQIRPYRTLDNKIDGAVLVLNDIDSMKSASERFRKAKEFSEAIIDTVREPLVVLDSDLRVMYANPAFLADFKVSRAETERKFLYRLGNEQWNIPKLRMLLEKLASDEAPVSNFEVEHDFPGLGTRAMLLNARQVQDAHSDEPLILLAIEDITESKSAGETLRQSHAEMESMVEKRTEALRRLSNQLQNVQDDERRRIARELHDSVGQDLVGIELNLAQMDESGLSQPKRAALSESKQLLHKCLAEIRTISYLLHPPMLDESGLASAAKWYVEGFAKRSSIQTNLDISPRLERLPKPVEMTLFRALQECLTNVHRHSGSSKVDVRIELEDGRAALSVRDYGRGFVPEQLESFKIGSDLGVGLAGMRERVSELGGYLQVLSENPGTSVRVAIPLGKSRLTPHNRLESL